MDDVIRQREKEKRAANFGRNLTSIASNRPSSDSLYLSQTTMDYIFAGDTHSYNEGELEKKIAQRTDDLPVRIQRLLNDLTALAFGGYINDPDEQWEDLLDMRTRAAETLVEKSTCASACGETRTGFDLGLVLSRLVGKATESERAVKFLWGFILAHASTEQGSNEREQKNLQDIFEKLNERWDETLSDSKSQWRPDTDPEAVSDFPIPEKLPAEDEIVQELDKYGIQPSPFLVRLLNSLVENKEYTTNKNLEEAAKEVVEDYADKKTKRCAELRAALSSEWSNISEASVPGADAEDVLETIWNIDTNQPSSDTIAIEIYGKSRYKRQVTHVLNHLSKEGKNPDKSLIPTYENSEIVYWCGRGWELTDYGELLCLFALEHNFDPEWMHKCVSEIDLDPSNSENESCNEVDILERGLRDYLSN